MAQKNTLKNKASKPKTTKKVSKVSKVSKTIETDFDSLPSKVQIKALKSKHLVSGQVYEVTKEIAKVLISKGNAELCQ